MFETRFFSINRLLKEYGETWKDPKDEQFGAEDIIDPRSFAAKLIADDADPLSQFLLGKLTSITRKQLSKCASSDSPLDRIFVANLVKDLNRILKDGDLFEKRRFDDVVLSTPLRLRAVELSKAESPKPAKAKSKNNTSELATLNRVLLEEAYPQELGNSIFQLSKIQLANQKGYEYVKDRSNKYFYLQCLLHGAARKKLGDDAPSGALFEDSVRDFLTKELQLLFGMYCFIDPKASDDVHAKPFYLLGSLQESDLAPSFTFPNFVNTRNLRNNREFHKLPDEWLAFYLHVNAVTRKQISFKDDFVKFFGDQEYRRNEELERKYNVFYASSGEMDHTILQWLFCSLGSDLRLDSEFAIPMTNLFPEKVDIDRCLNSRDEKRETVEHAHVIDAIVTRVGNEYYLKCPPREQPDNKRSVGKKSNRKQTIREWLQGFGLLVDDPDRAVPSERLLAAIEFFYFHLKNLVETAVGGNIGRDPKIGHNTAAYFYLKKEKESHYYGDYLNPENPACLRKVKKFIAFCETKLPVKSQSYSDIRNKGKGDRVLRQELDEILTSYLEVLRIFATLYEGKGIDFAEYGRFNILSHFFQRNVLPIYNPLLKEQTCRGFVIIPIFSNPHTSTTNIKDVGYFLGLIKDSDNKGRCYFNWRTQSDNKTENEIGDFFYNEYLFHLQNFVYNLGFKEVKQIYYKGIEDKHNNEIKRQASRAAISQVMARNMSHNIGSHVLSRYKSTSNFTSEDLKDTSQYKAAKMNVNPLLNSRVVDDQGDSAATQRAYFNEYLKNRMDFLADVATTDPTLESHLYLLKDVLAGFDKNRILLDRISGLDSNIQFDIAVSVKDEEGELQAIHGEGNSNDQLLAMPNDILGCQAFYIIIENIIRNVTKHSKADERPLRMKSLTFLINVVLEKYKKNAGYYEVSIYDSFSETPKKMAEIVEKRNALIAAPVLDARTNKLRDVGLGTVEMVVCAAYLRRVPLDLIETDFYRLNDQKCADRDGVKIPNVIYAYSQETDNQKVALGYKFYIRVPQKLLVFDDDNWLNLSPGQINNYRAKGITVLKSQDLRDDWEYSHEVLIWLNDKTRFHDFYHLNGTTLPQRVLVNDEQFSPEELLVGNLDEAVWRIYLRELFRLKKVSGFRIVRSTSRKPINYPPDEAGRLSDIFIDDHDKKWSTYCNDDSTYYEMCCSHHRLQMLDLRVPYHLMRYLESVVTSVIIIDERVQANLTTARYADRLPLKDYFEKMSIFVPSEDRVNLNKLSFSDKKDNVETQLQEYLASKLKAHSAAAADFCVLHLGIVEKLLSNSAPVTPDMVEKKITSLVGAENLDKVIITTGRGKPTNISARFRYVPLAIIQHCIDTLFDKGMLVTSLYNARRSK
jgi:hypothetical protein